MPSLYRGGHWGPEEGGGAVFRPGPPACRPQFLLNPMHPVASCLDHTLVLILWIQVNNEYILILTNAWKRNSLLLSCALERKILIERNKNNSYLLSVKCFTYIISSNPHPTTIPFQRMTPRLRKLPKSLLLQGQMETRLSICLILKEETDRAGLHLRPSFEH